MKKIVLVTGGFDPLHSGHIAYFQEARKLGDILVVGVNSDAWLERKKGRAFMPHLERINIVRNIKGVDFVIGFNDSDGSAKNAIELVRKSYPGDRIIFANGGDRTQVNIPEMDIIDDNLEFVFGVGGEDKKNSSSWILQEWKAPKTERPWGYYRVLHEVPGMKVKELTVNPGQSLSMQRHNHRSEYWIVSEGECKVEKEFAALFLRQHETIRIPVTDWHQLSNPTDKICRIVEIQYGNRCEEDDIERKL
jgi:cytidyltransferase-like protein